VPAVDNRRRLAAALFLLAYFLFFFRQGFGAAFPLDSVGNIGGYWHRGWGRLLLSLFLPWTGPYRPVGGLFYLAVFSGFGLRPAAFHVATAVILLGVIYLVYRVARFLGAGELTSWLAALIVCYHAGLSNLYYNTSFVYDVLCAFFYLAALAYYIGIRNRGRLLRGREMLVFLGLYLISLYSKEMAVSLPLVLLAYEWIYHKPGHPRNREAIEQWMGSAAAVACLAALLNVIFICGLKFGPEPLMGAPGYRTILSLRQVRIFQTAYLGDLLFGWDWGWRAMLFFWAVLAYFAWRRPDRLALRFCWIYMLVTPLPIMFLEGRAGACLAIPFVAWAIYAAVLFTDFAEAVTRFLLREPVIGRLGREDVLLLVVAGAVLLWARLNWNQERSYVKPVVAALGGEMEKVIWQFRTVNPHVRHGSQVAFLDDPLGSWDMLFVAELWFHDRSVHIHVPREGPLSAEDLAKMDSVFTFEDGCLMQVK
jgi:hypothetical protein